MTYHVAYFKLRAVQYSMFNAQPQSNRTNSGNVILKLALRFMGV